MSGGGYVPLFSSLTSGTLCGRWPDIGLWPIVLSLADRHGVVDVTPDFLARITGLPVDEVAACMRRFCEADAHSRSSAENGARLVLIDPGVRPWGWRVVNHAQYREKARKAAYDAARTASGRDAERKQEEREATRDVPRCPDGPDASRAVPLSDSDSNSNSNYKNKNSRPLARTPASQLHREIIAAYHEVLPELPRLKVWSRKREAWLSSRIRERCEAGKPADDVAYWRAFFESVRASDFLSGRAGDFRCDLEWLLKSENFTKTIEGRYANRGNGATRAHR